MKIPSKITQKLNRFVRDTTRKFTPIVQDEMRKTINKTTTEIGERAFDVAKLLFFGYCAIDIMAGTKTVPISFQDVADLGRAINISYYETHITNNYYNKGGT